MSSVIDLSKAERPARDLVPVSDAAALLQVIERAARDPSVDIVKLKELFAMRKEIAMEAAETAFNQAMNEAQRDIRPIAADAENPQTRSKYATYAKLDRALRPIYTKHGFSISYDEADSPKQDHVRVLAYVAHASGFMRTYHTDMPADGKGAKGGDVMTKTHAAGAAKSYGMRYLLRGIFNVAVGEEDNDGNDIERITEKQAADLKAKLDELGPKAYTNFLKAGKINTLAEIPAKNYEACVKLVEAKLRAGAAS